MATLLMILLIVGYGLSVWSLKRQAHFGERRFGRLTAARGRRHGWRLRHGAVR